MLYILTVHNHNSLLHMALLLRFGKGYTVSLCMKQGLYDRSEEEYPPHLNHTDSSDDDCPMLDAMPSSLNGMPPAMSLSSFRECLKRTMGMAITFNFVNKVRDNRVSFGAFDIRILYNCTFTSFFNSLMGIAYACALYSRSMCH